MKQKSLNQIFHNPSFWLLNYPKKLEDWLMQIKITVKQINYCILIDIYELSLRNLATRSHKRKNFYMITYQPDKHKLFLRNVYYTDEGIKNAVYCFTCLLETSLQSMNCDRSLYVNGCCNWFVFTTRMAITDDDLGLENC